MNQFTTFRFWNKPTALATFAALALLVIVGCNKTTNPADPDPTDPDPAELRAELIAEGEVLFGSCTACHGSHGEGESAPPLLHSDYLIAERLRPVRILLMGLPNAIDSDPTITVNGIEHTNNMPAIAKEWSDREIAAVLTYVRASLNDSTSTNCVVGENEDGQPVSECDIVQSPADAITTITPQEVGTLRDSLETAGLLE